MHLPVVLGAFLPNWVSHAHSNENITYAFDLCLKLCYSQLKMVKAIQDPSEVTCFAINENESKRTCFVFEINTAHT